MLNLRFAETSQNFSSFRHLFLRSFQEGDERKKTLRKPMYNLVNFSSFFLRSPLRNYERQSCLKELKFCEVSEIPKSSICWKFQRPITKTVGCPHFCMANISKWKSSFFPVKTLVFCYQNCSDLLWEKIVLKVS